MFQRLPDIIRIVCGDFGFLHGKPFGRHIDKYTAHCQPFPFSFCQFFRVDILPAGKAVRRAVSVRRQATLPDSIQG